MDPRGRVFGMLLRFDGGSASSFVMDSLDIVSCGGGFRRFLPNIMPVDRRNGSGASSDNIKHKLSPITAVTIC